MKRNIFKRKAKRKDERKSMPPFPHRGPLAEKDLLENLIETFSDLIKDVFKEGLRSKLKDILKK